MGPQAALAKSIVKSDKLFSYRLSWLKSIRKSVILSTVFSHRLPWLKIIVKSDIPFSPQTAVAKKYTEI
jgi:hypothetical protein